MPRRREVPKREVLPDPKFRETDVSKFINVVMLHGKKAVAEGIVYGAFEYIETNAKKSPLDVFQQALANCKPVVEVKSRRVGGANYQVPVEVRPSRRMALGMRWIRESAKKRSVKSTWPGVSIMLILCSGKDVSIPFQKHVVAADVMVIPRSCSCSIQSIVAAPSCTSPIL